MCVNLLAIFCALLFGSLILLTLLSRTQLSHQLQSHSPCRRSVRCHPSKFVCVFCFALCDLIRVISLRHSIRQFVRLSVRPSSHRSGAVVDWLSFSLPHLSFHRLLCSTACYHPRSLTYPPAHLVMADGGGQNRCVHNLRRSRPRFPRPCLLRSHRPERFVRHECVENAFVDSPFA